MVKTLSKVFFVAAMLIAFLGQAMPIKESFFCEIFPASDVAYYDIEDVNISKKAKDISETKDDCCDVECCDIDCICTASACSSHMYLSGEIGTFNVITLSETAPLSQSKRPNSIVSLPYRPPIITS